MCLRNLSFFLRSLGNTSANEQRGVISLSHALTLFDISDLDIPHDVRI